MYHIKDDRRSQASAEAIVLGLQKCLQSGPLKSVTVSDIHRASGVSRATFYRLFDTPDDVLHYQLDRMAAKVEENDTPEEHLNKTISLGMENNELLRALVENRRIDLMFEYTEKSFQKLDSQYGLFPDGVGKVEREYILTHLSMSMVATLIAWARNGRRETPEEVASYLKKYVQLLNGLLGE